MPSEDSLKKRLRTKLLKTNWPLIAATMKEGLSLEGAMEAVHDFANDIAERAALATEKEEVGIEPAPEAQDCESADCIESKQLLNTIIDSPQNDAAYPAAYSPHLADYRRKAYSTNQPIEKVPCDDCHRPMLFGATICPNCERLYAPSYWRGYK